MEPDSGLEEPEPRLVRTDPAGRAGASQAHPPVGADATTVTQRLLGDVLGARQLEELGRTASLHRAPRGFLLVAEGLPQRQDLRGE